MTPATSPRELHRPRGLDTSRDAAEQVVERGVVALHEGEIVRALKGMPQGGTSVDIAAAIARDGLELTTVEIARRYAALIRRGEIHRRWDPERPGKRCRRGGFTVHWAGPEARVARLSRREAKAIQKMLAFPGTQREET